MTDCRSIEPLLSAWLDDELDGSRARGIRMHVAACDRCRAESDALHRLRGRLRSVPARTLPADVRARIPAAPVGPRPFAPVLMLVGLALLLMVVLSSTSASPPQRTIADPAERWLTDQVTQTPMPAGVMSVSGERR